MLTINNVVKVAVQEIEALLNLLVEECSSGILSHCEPDHGAPVENALLALRRAVHNQEGAEGQRIEIGRVFER